MDAETPSAHSTAPKTQPSAADPQRSIDVVPAWRVCASRLLPEASKRHESQSHNVAVMTHSTPMPPALQFCLLMLEDL